ncbi:MAG TPA: hypothetical protein VKG26_15625, partial [Bacteroidia bacterium]|nr:hypothetical protein [Bacteroidia bacterium]
TNVKLIRKIKDQNEQREREQIAKEQKTKDSTNKVVEAQYAKIAKADSIFEDFNALSITKLGWINCDRFNNDPNEKIEFVIENEDISFQARLVFTDIKSMMPSRLNNNNKNCFSNIPLNKNVRVVAIRITDSEPYIALAETNTNTKTCKLEFKKYSKKEALKLFEGL